MALQTSGAISLNDIHIEAGGSSGTSVSINDADVRGLIDKGSGATMSFNEWYGATAETVLTSAGTVNGQDQQKRITVSSFISSGGTLRIPSNLWVWSDSTGAAALTIDIPCTIINEGKIIGCGGRGGQGFNGGGASGGRAIHINSGVTGVTITNSSGAYIAGGGGGGGANSLGPGGGGGGAGGGRGGNSGSASGGAGGALNAAGSNGGKPSWAYGSPGYGGGAGGGGGRGQSDPSPGAQNGGGGGGRILPGTGATINMDGGSAGNAGQNASSSVWCGGGGGWGAVGGYGPSGGRRGSGGKAIEDSGQTYTLTNNGTIYGGT